MRTNPAYAALAYQKAVLKYTINFLMENVVAAHGGDPREVIVCEDVFREDSEVPIDNVLSFIENLQEQQADIQLQINKFEFRQRDDSIIAQQSQATKALPEGAQESPTGESSPT